VDDSDLISTSWVDDPSCCFGFWVDDPSWVDHPVLEGEKTLFGDGSGRANLKPFSRPLPSRMEALATLGGMTSF